MVADTGPIGKFNEFIILAETVESKFTDKRIFEVSSEKTQ